MLWGPRRTPFGRRTGIHRSENSRGARQHSIALGLAVPRIGRSPMGPAGLNSCGALPERDRPNRLAGVNPVPRGPMGKKHAKPPVAPAVHPDGFWVYFIRQDDGAAKAHLFNGAQCVETAAKAAWDDALPWAAGTYHTSSTGIVGDKGGLEFRFNSPAIPYREGIRCIPVSGAYPSPRTIRTQRYSTITAPSAAWWRRRISSSTSTTNRRPSAETDVPIWSSTKGRIPISA